MTTRYIALDATQFESFLVSNGFTRNIVGHEVVYSLPFDVGASRFSIRVFTSIANGDTVGRECGKDAIRVVAVFVPCNKITHLPVVYKGPRVYRTGSNDLIKQRTLSRIQEAQARCKEYTEGSGSWIGATSIKAELVVKERRIAGDRFGFVFNDNIGRTLVYWTDRDLLRVGSKYLLSFEVKRHYVFAGVKTTEIINARGKQIGVQ